MVKLVRVPSLADQEPPHDIGWAHAALTLGARVRRRGWNGRSMFIFLVPGSVFTVDRSPMKDAFPLGTRVAYRSHVDICTADGTLVPWLCSQTDFLAEDWEIAV